MAKELGVVPSAVSNWKTNGLPPNRVLDFLDLAESYPEAGVTLAQIRAAIRPEPS